MSFCDHCDGQRFDRSRLLRILRKHRRECDPASKGAEALSKAIEAIRALGIPPLERVADGLHGDVIHRLTPVRLTTCAKATVVRRSFSEGGRRTLRTSEKTTHI